MNKGRGLKREPEPDEDGLLKGKAGKIGAYIIALLFIAFLIWQLFFMPTWIEFFNR